MTPKEKGVLARTSQAVSPRTLLMVAQGGSGRACVDHQTAGQPGQLL